MAKNTSTQNTVPAGYALVQGTGHPTVRDQANWLHLEFSGGNAELLVAKNGLWAYSHVAGIPGWEQVSGPGLCRSRLREPSVQDLVTVLPLHQGASKQAAKRPTRASQAPAVTASQQVTPAPSPADSKLEQLMARLDTLEAQNSDLRAQLEEANQLLAMATEQAEESASQ